LARHEWELLTVIASYPSKTIRVAYGHGHVDHQGDGGEDYDDVGDVEAGGGAGRWATPWAAVWGHWSSIGCCWKEE